MDDAGRGLDDEGYIVPEVTSAQVAPPYRATIEALREACTGVFGHSLHSLYLYGSVARGTAVPNTSDLDALAVLHTLPEESQHQGVRRVAQALVTQYPFLTGASILLSGTERIISEEERYDMGFFVKCLCACVYGDDLAAQLPRYTPSLELARGTNGNIGQLLDQGRERLTGTEDPEAIKATCRGIMRKIVRTGFTLVIPRYHGWTSDLSQCAEIFARYYPAKRQEMDTARELAAKPSPDRSHVLAIIATLGEWLASEYERVILRQFDARGRRRPRLESRSH